MGLFRSVAGQISVELMGADIVGSISGIMKDNIPISQVRFRDDVTVSFTVSRKDYRKLADFAKRRGDRLQVLGRSGLYWVFRSLAARPVLLSGMVLLLILSLWLPGRVYFVEVEGNVRIPDRLILESAADSGIRFGASRRKVRSEQIKNKLLGIMPELQWAGVNTYGCRAVITVRERQDDSPAPEVKRVSSIVASRDGIVTSCTVTKGNGLCTVGQAVRKGQILISGYTDCGITITATCAEGEIEASTLRQLTVVTPGQCQSRRYETGKHIKYTLVIGKKRINFYKGSGISGGSCVKMYSEYVLSLPGGFQLPVKLIRQEITDYHTEQAAVSDADRLLENCARDYLTSQMVAGSIHHEARHVEESDELFRLTGLYTCTEMIGIDREEKIGEFNGKTDGTDRERGSGG